MGLVPLTLLTFSANSQSQTDTVLQSVKKLETEIAAMKKAKVSGYIQTQYQIADTAGIKSYSGGDFKEGVDNRFMVRRGRIKADYKSKGVQTVLQIDVTEKGLAIKDAYISFSPLLLNAVTFTGGMFNRPFGYEISYSSSMRESPERGRMSGILFPGERDLGAKITLQGPEKSKWNFLTLEAGLFNGTGAPKAGADASDFDSFKDFIGRMALSKSFKEGNIKASVAGSFYHGGWAQDTVFNFTIGQINDSTSGFVKSSGKVKRFTKAEREYTGVDAQLAIKSEIGLTILRAEFISGRQPGSSKNSDSPQARPADNTYFRKFNGAYFYFIQNIKETGLSVVLKYDWFDPNSDMQGNTIGKTGNNTSQADLKYTTLGSGLRYDIKGGLSFTAWYDMVKNETTQNIEGYQKDIKDNVITLRMQLKF